MFALDAIFGHSPGHNTALNKNIYIKIHRACLVRRRTSNVAHKSLCAKNRIHPESAAAEPTRQHQSCFYILVFALGNHYLCDVRNVLLRCSVGATRSQSAANTVPFWEYIWSADGLPLPYTRIYSELGLWETISTCIVYLGAVAYSDVACAPCNQSNRHCLRRTKAK